MARHPAVRGERGEAGRGGRGKRTAESFEILISFQIHRRAALKSSEMVGQSRHGSDEARGGGSVFVFFRVFDKQADVMRTSEGLQQKGNYFEKTLLATLYYY